MSLEDQVDTFCVHIECDRVQIVCAGAMLTHEGLVRRVNEDSVWTSGPVFAVADGMGGHLFGDLASQTAKEVFTGIFGSNSKDCVRVRCTSADELLGAIRLSHSAVAKAGASALTRTLGVESGLVADPAVFEAYSAKSGTTLSGIALCGGANCAPFWNIFNVGDSRVYRVGEEGIMQITQDHSAIAEMLSIGIIDEKSAKEHPSRNIITRAVGTKDEVNPDFTHLSISKGDRFLICTDGLVRDTAEDVLFAVTARVREMFDKSPDVELVRTLAKKTVLALVNRALQDGGGDNISVLYLQCVDYKE